MNAIVKIKDTQSDNTIEFAPVHIKILKQNYKGMFTDQNGTRWIFSRHHASKTIRLLSKFNRIIISYDDIPL